MKKYIQPAIYVFEIKMESALLGSSNLQELSTSNEVVDSEVSEEYTHHKIWDNTAWPYEE